MAFVSTILCVDDDEDDIFFIREVIAAQPHSFHIDEARNGQEAMAYLSEAVEKNLLPCLIIMDINMPKMDGKQAINRIKEHPELARIPVVVFTTSGNSADRSYFESRDIHFITKPFEYKVFTRQIVELLAFCADLEG
jgi:CheY-like chemotaxis protein